jgi:hypothetical protein
VCHVHLHDFLSRARSGIPNIDSHHDLAVAFQLLINRTDSPNHALMFRLIGTKSNKAAIGARVTVKAGDLTQMNEIQAGSSYLSQNDLRLHFGMGAHATVDRVEILWPSGKRDILSNLPADSIYTVVEGEGQRSSLFERQHPGRK